MQQHVDIQPRVPALKRPLDVVGASLGLILFSPLLLVVALAVRVVLGSPVLFRQTRPGLHARPFSLCKFRTMRDMIDGRGVMLSDEQRLGRFGRLLRATSLDELPELWNVLRGDMSLVGPRPLLMQYLHLYTPRQARRHDVKPGITGWAQINGRNAITWEEKFEHDVWYVEHCTLALDLRILVVTVFRVLTAAGISRDGHATAPEFRGSAQ